MKTADPELMRAINRFHVLDTIRRHGAIARVEIGERTELSATTVSAITAALLDDGLITVRHEGDIRSQALRGRPRVMLALNPDAARVVGAKLAADRVVLVATSFGGDVLASVTMAAAIEQMEAGAIADLVSQGVTQCLAAAGLAPGQIKTLALSVPGTIEHGTGNILGSGVLRETGTALRAAIASRTGIETIIEGDANAVAMGQHWFGQARALDDFVLVSLEPVLGLGVMHGGQLFRGAHGLSLTLGDLVMGTDMGSGKRLAELAGQQAMLSPGAPDAVARAGTALGMAIANLVALFAPPRVIIVGSRLGLGEMLLAPLREAFAGAIPAPLAGLAEIVIDDCDDALWARGAAAVALGELYGSPWGTTGPARRAP